MRPSTVLAAALVLAAAAASGKSVNESSQLAPPTILSRARARCPIGCRRSTRSRTSTSRPRCDAGMAEQRKEIDAIAKNPAAPTFENTIVAMERSGQLLTRASAVFCNLTASNTNPQLEAAADRDVAEAVGAQRRDLPRSGAVRARARRCTSSAQSLKLDPESLRLLERYHTNFVRAGAQPVRRRQDASCKQLNEQISTLDDRVPPERAEGRERRRRRRRQRAPSSTA